MRISVLGVFLAFSVTTAFAAAPQVFKYNFNIQYQNNVGSLAPLADREISVQAVYRRGSGTIPLTRKHKAKTDAAGDAEIKFSANEIWGFDLYYIEPICAALDGSVYCNSAVPATDNKMVVIDHPEKAKSECVYTATLEKVADTTDIQYNIVCRAKQ